MRAVSSDTDNCTKTETETETETERESISESPRVHDPSQEGTINIH